MQTAAASKPGYAPYYLLLPREQACNADCRGWGPLPKQALPPHSAESPAFAFAFAFTFALAFAFPCTFAFAFAFPFPFAFAFPFPFAFPFACAFT